MVVLRGLRLCIFGLRFSSLDLGTRIVLLGLFDALDKEIINDSGRVAFTSREVCEMDILSLHSA